MRPNRMRLILRFTPGLRPGLVVSLLSAFDPLQHGQGSLTPGASPGTVRDLEGRAFRALRPDPGNPGLAPGVSGHPVLERPHRAIQRVALHRLLPRPADQRHDLIVGQPHRGAGAGFVVDALEHHRALEVVARSEERRVGKEWRAWWAT